MTDHRICRCDCGEPTPYDDHRCDECREREDDQDRPKLPSADDVWEVAKTMPASATWADALREWKRRQMITEYDLGDTDPVWTDAELRRLQCRDEAGQENV